MDTVIEDFNNIDNVNDVGLIIFPGKMFLCLQMWLMLLKIVWAKKPKPPQSQRYHNGDNWPHFFQRTSYNSKSSVEIKYFWNHQGGPPVKHCLGKETWKWKLSFERKILPNDRQLFGGCSCGVCMGTWTLFLFSETLTNIVNNTTTSSLTQG